MAKQPPEWTKKLPDQLGDWMLGDYLGEGHSAAVFSATSKGVRRAIKVFNSQEEFIRESKEFEGRLFRQKELIGCHHENLVEIFEVSMDTHSNFHYLVMDFLPYDDLSEHIGELNDEDIVRVIRDVSKAAMYLENNGIVHRDIKPANICWNSDARKATLLDIGVIKPIAKDDLLPNTDYETQFVGSSRYSPPEFILRKEDDSLEGWRAVTFYQIGTVVFELLEGIRIFQGSDKPLALLHNNILKGNISWTNKHKNRQLEYLTRTCLKLLPAQRIEQISWENLQNLELKKDDLDSIKNRLSGICEEESNEPSKIIKKVDKAILRNIEDVIRIFLSSEDNVVKDYSVETLIQLDEAAIKIEFAISNGTNHIKLEVLLLISESSDSEILIIGRSSIPPLTHFPTETLYLGSKDIKETEYEHIYVYILSSIETAILKHKNKQ